MTEKYYKLVGKDAVPCDLMEWARSMSEADKRRVAEDYVGENRVSTVFLGLDHQFGQGPPLIFETMVFGGDSPLEVDMRRYSTWDEAEEGYKKMVQKYAKVVIKDD